MATKSRKRSDWSCPLPQPLQILNGDKPIMTLATVGDVRELIAKRLPEDSRKKSTWQYVAGLALDAANGGVDLGSFAFLRHTRHVTVGIKRGPSSALFESRL